MALLKEGGARKREGGIARERGNGGEERQREGKVLTCEFSPLPLKAASVCTGLGVLEDERV